MKPKMATPDKTRVRAAEVRSEANDVVFFQEKNIITTSAHYYAFYPCACPYPSCVNTKRYTSCYTFPDPKRNATSMIRDAMTSYE